MRMVAQYFVLRNNSEKDIADGLIDLFGKSLLRILRTLLYSKLSYLLNITKTGSCLLEHK